MPAPDVPMSAIIIPGFAYLAGVMKNEMWVAVSILRASMLRLVLIYNKKTEQASDMFARVLRDTSFCRNWASHDTFLATTIATTLFTLTKQPTTYPFTLFNSLSFPSGHRSDVGTSTVYDTFENEKNLVEEHSAKAAKRWEM